MRVLAALLLIACSPYQHAERFDLGPQPAKIQPVQDCYTLVNWLARRLASCQSDPMQGELAAKWLTERYLAAAKCEEMVVTWDRARLYGQCHEDIDILSCAEVAAGNAPSSCSGLFGREK